MIICINCSTETKKKMDNLLINNNYKDYSELMSVAVENIWILENEIAQKGAFVFEDGFSVSITPPKSQPVKKTLQKGTKKEPLTQSRLDRILDGISIPDPNVPIRIPELFLAEGLEAVSVITMEVSPTEITNETFTLDRWLFGQFNKLLPVKANCRALVRLTADQENIAPLFTTASQIAEAAQLLGDYLADQDRHNKIDRDEALATAFPRSGPGDEKSRARYANQFVGSLNSHNELSGLLWDYRLVGLDLGNGPRLLPTEKAFHLARLINPILDEQHPSPSQKFSLEEVAFFLEHIQSYVPVEAFAFRTLIKAITDGADTPDKLDEALRSLIPANTNRSLSPSFLTSQRSGTLSRMADLGLIKRLRKGIRVSYKVTEQAFDFIKRN